jgi:hypothetical protein
MWNTVLKEWFNMKAKKNDSTAADAVVILTGDAR